MAIGSEAAMLAESAMGVLVAEYTYGYIAVLYDPVSEASNSLTYDYELPAGSIVGAASVTIAAEPAGRTAIGNVARVRPADGALGSTTSLVVDFGGLRTVSSLDAPEVIQELRPWTGTAFSTTMNLVPTSSGSSGATFTEVATERLLVRLASAVTSDELATGGRVTLHDRPADIELLVAGERVHIEPGPVRAEGARYEQTVDITAAVQRAVDAGAVPVPLELRSSVAAALSITPDPGAHVLAHRVRFPEGARRTISAADEGVLELRLPLAAGASSWHVRRLRFDVQGAVGDRRVLPPDGPAIAPGAELVIDPDRPMVVRIPPSTVRSFKSVDSLRVLLRAERTTELSGHLAAEEVGTGGQAGPGAPVPDAELVAMTVEVGDAMSWVTLPLHRPTPLDPEVGAWAVIQVTRGQAVVPLAAPTGDDEDDALVLRQSANGRYRPLPTVDGVHTSAIPLRVGGEPPSTAPIAALVVAVPGAPNSPVEVTPGPAPQSFELTFDPALGDGGDALLGEEMRVELTVVGPGDHTIGPIVVGYEES